MTFIDVVFASTIGQLAMVAVVFLGWLVWQLGRISMAFATAARGTKVTITCERKA